MDLINELNSLRSDLGFAKRDYDLISKYVTEKSQRDKILRNCNKRIKRIERKIVATEKMINKGI